MWILVLFALVGGIYLGYDWGRREGREMESENRILCTPEQVAEAVLQEDNSPSYDFGVTVKEARRMKAERIAANLIQLVETKGEKTSG